jgi:hypothetical protein
MLEMYLRPHVNNPLNCNHFSEIQNGMIKFGTILHFIIKKKIRPAVIELLHAVRHQEGQTHPLHAFTLCTVY